MPTTKFCADCGMEINKTAEICPKCGVRQLTEKGKNISVIVVFVVVLLGGFAAIGLISAIAIPQFSAYKIKAHDASALSNLKSAKAFIEAYYADNNKYPVSLEAAGFKSSEDVQVLYYKSNTENYTLQSVHLKGCKEYSAKAHDSSIYQRDKVIKGEFKTI